MTIESLETLAVEGDVGTASTRIGGSTGGAGSLAAGRDELAVIDPRRYVVREELARGGMGRVSIALDTQLGRIVAIKELIAPQGDLVARFRRELALTARLQHPAIVSIHDGGAWTNGELVYVMRLVKGESLDAVIARATTTRERMALLPHAIAVVHALAYAHAQRIIHRDLKPANILVGDFGETVVIDWGIAKDLDRPDIEAVTLGPYRDEPSDAQTMAGAVLGTPAYMPPEQALGEPVDSRADVYALGAVLYHLLAGVPPHTGKSLAEILVSVIDRKPPPLPPEVPRDLVAIVTKAMAPEAKDRYATAGELAVDLERFHAGQLVGAHSYSTWQLVRRWLRRHRTTVSVAALALLVIAGVGVASVTRIIREQQRSAEAERLALESRRDAERLLDFMLVELRDKLVPVGKVDLLATVAAQAHDYYERRPPTDDDDQHRRILTLQNLGAVRLAQGDLPAALVEYRASLARAEALVARAPTNPTWRLDLAVAHRHVAAALRQTGDLPAALAGYRAGLAIAQAGPESDTAWQAELARVQIQLADVLREQGDQPGALATYRAALAIASRLAVRLPDDPIVQRDAMIAHNKLGTGLRAQDDLDGGLVEHRAALAIVERLVARDPSNLEWQRDLAVSRDNVGRVLKAQKDYAGALVEYRMAMDIAERIAARDPLDTNAQRNVAISLNVISKVLLEQKDYDGALAGYRRSLAIRERLGATDPSNALWQRDLSVNHYMVGDVLEDRGDHDAALVEYRAALKIADELAARDRTNSSWQVIAKELRETVETCCKAKR